MFERLRAGAYHKAKFSIDLNNEDAFELIQKDLKGCSGLLSLIRDEYEVPEKESIQIREPTIEPMIEKKRPSKSRLIRNPYYRPKIVSKVHSNKSVNLKQINWKQLEHMTGEFQDVLILVPLYSHAFDQVALSIGKTKPELAKILLDGWRSQLEVLLSLVAKSKEHITDDSTVHRLNLQLKNCSEHHLFLKGVFDSSIARRDHLKERRKLMISQVANSEKTNEGLDMKERDLVQEKQTLLMELEKLENEYASECEYLQQDHRLDEEVVEYKAEFEAFNQAVRDVETVVEQQKLRDLVEEDEMRMTKASDLNKIKKVLNDLSVYRESLERQKASLTIPYDSGVSVVLSWDRADTDTELETEKRRRGAVTKLNIPLPFVSLLGDISKSSSRKEKWSVVNINKALGRLHTLATAVTTGSYAEFVYNFFFDEYCDEGVLVGFLTSLGRIQKNHCGAWIFLKLCDTELFPTQFYHKIGELLKHCVFADDETRWFPAELVDDVETLTTGTKVNIDDYIILQLKNNLIQIM